MESARGPVGGIRIDRVVQTAVDEPTALLAFRGVRVAPVRLSAYPLTRSRGLGNSLVDDTIHDGAIGQVMGKVNRRIARLARHDIDRQPDVAFLYPAWALGTPVARLVVPGKISNGHPRQR